LKSPKQLHAIIETFGIDAAANLRDRSFNGQLKSPRGAIAPTSGRRSLGTAKAPNNPLPCEPSIAVVSALVGSNNRFRCRTLAPFKSLESK